MSKNIKQELDEETVIDDITNVALSMDKNNKLTIGLAEVLYTLFRDYLTYDLERPFWANRDRLVISDSRLSSLYYSLLYFMSNDYSLTDLKNYGKRNSPCTKDLSYGRSNREEVSSGIFTNTLGTSIGLAMAEKKLEERYNTDQLTLFEYYTYLICTKENLKSGKSYEALSIASEYGLDNFICICAYLNNDAGLEKDRIIDTYMACDYDVMEIKNFDNTKEIEKTFDKASKSDRPVMIIVNIEEDIINDYQGNYIHSTENTKLLKADIITRLKEEYKDWYNNYRLYMSSASDKDKNELAHLLNSETDPLKLDKIIDMNKLNCDKPLSYINYQIINIISSFLPNFLMGSNYPYAHYLLKGKNIYNSDNYLGKNIILDNRDYIIGEIMNAFTLTGYRPYTYSKLICIDRMKEAIRYSALMNIPSIYIFDGDTFDGNSTCDSPVEEIASLRNIPNLEVYRPCDYKELVGTWNEVLESTKPCVIILSDKKLESFKYTSVSEVASGGYVISEVKNRLDLILLSSGSEVELAMKLKQELLKNYIEARVVTVPNLKKFIDSDASYLAQVLPKGYKRVALEKTNDPMWQTILNTTDDFICLNSFSKNGPIGDVEEYYGLDMSSLVIRIKENL